MITCWLDAAGQQFASGLQRGRRGKECKRYTTTGGEGGGHWLGSCRRYALDVERVALPFNRSFGGHQRSLGFSELLQGPFISQL